MAGLRAAYINYLQFFGPTFTFSAWALVIRLGLFSNYYNMGESSVEKTCVSCDRRAFLTQLSCAGPALE